MKIIIKNEDQEIVYFDSSIIRIDVNATSIFIAFGDKTSILFELDAKPIIKRHIYHDQICSIKDIQYEKIYFVNKCIRSEYQNKINIELFYQIKALIYEN